MPKGVDSCYAMAASGLPRVETARRIELAGRRHDTAVAADLLEDVAPASIDRIRYFHLVSARIVCSARSG